MANVILQINQKIGKTTWEQECTLSKFNLYKKCYFMKSFNFPNNSSFYKSKMKYFLLPDRMQLLSTSKILLNFNFKSHSSLTTTMQLTSFENYFGWIIMVELSGVPRKMTYVICLNQSKLKLTCINKTNSKTENYDNTVKYFHNCNGNKSCNKKL